MRYPRAAELGARLLRSCLRRQTAIRAPLRRRAVLPPASDLARCRPRGSRAWDVGTPLRRGRRRTGTARMQPWMGHRRLNPQLRAIAQRRPYHIRPFRQPSPAQGPAAQWTLRPQRVDGGRAAWRRCRRRPAARLAGPHPVRMPAAARAGTRRLLSRGSRAARRGIRPPPRPPAVPSRCGAVLASRRSRRTGAPL